MKLAKTAIYSRARAMPQLRFEDQHLTSFAGLVILQGFFRRIRLTERLERCCSHLDGSRLYKFQTVLRCLILHVMLGYRPLRDVAYYRDDPMVQRLLELKGLPSVPTISRMLGEFDEASVEAQRAVNRELVLEGVGREQLRRLTLDFDGSVQSTKRHAEGTAVGFNKHKKGARSYYPLFCTLAQTGQVFDLCHRPGNVHDSHGAPAFVRACVQAARAAYPGVQIEVRMDSAFFSDEMTELLEELGVRYSISVPFERLTELKAKIERRVWWWRLNAAQGYFEVAWKPKCWATKRRFILVRSREAQQRKEPIQLDLFTPQVYGYAFKAIVTNHPVGARKVVALHEGRGYQEHVLGELKTDGALAYVPVRSCRGNQVYRWAGILAHNLARDLQMRVTAAATGTTERRTPKWRFQTLRHLRQSWIQRAGRLTAPAGQLTLTLSPNPEVEAALRLFGAAA